MVFLLNYNLTEEGFLPIVAHGLTCSETHFYGSIWRSRWMGSLRLTIDFGRHAAASGGMSSSALNTPTKDFP
jgi:hypothetical protein